METNVNLEFINKVDVLSEKMRDLAAFWLENEKELAEANVFKDYPFDKSFEDLTFDVFNWRIALVVDYCEK